MGLPRILILEDDPVMAMHLETLVGSTLEAEIVTAVSLAEANLLLERCPDFALLDIDVADGTTYGIATWLADRRVPFAFVSASNREHLPTALKTAAFVAKPYEDDAIVALLERFTRSRREEENGRP